MSEPDIYSQSSTSELDELRIPPHSIQAEQSVLGGLMLSNTAWDQVADRVVKEDFYRREHQLIFLAIQSLADDQKPFDVVTLSEELERRGCLDDAGGMSYIGTLAKDTPSAANIAAYADIVREHSVKRQLIRVGTEIADSGFQTAGMKVTELLDNAERMVFEIAEQQSKGKSGFKNIKTLLTSAVDRIETLFEQDEERALHAAIETAVSRGDAALEAEDFEAAMAALRENLEAPRVRAAHFEAAAMRIARRGAG